MFYKMDLKNSARRIRKQMAIGTMPAVWDVMSPAIRLLANAVVLKKIGMIFCLKFGV